MGAMEKSTLNLAWRIRLAIGVVFLSFFLIGLRLWYLQILRGDYFRDRSENNRLRQIYIPPPRGGIVSREGVTLVRNRPAFNIDLVREDCGKCDDTLAELANVVEMPLEEIKRLSRLPQKKRRRFEPVLLLKDVPRDMVAKIAARKHALPGIVVSVVPSRDYVFGSFAAHVLGYLGEISAKQLENPDFSGYRSGDVVGQYGIERVQERLLQGQRGEKGIIVNAMGTRISEAYYEEEQPGFDLSLTLDFKMQGAAETAMHNLKGAVVALDPATGEILTMVSKPDFDPNLFSGGIRSQDWSRLVQDKDRPLSNRVVQGEYHPGSVFKFIMAAAGLAEGVVHPGEPVHCGGSFRVGNSRPFHCHKTHGTVTLESAIEKSCNVYFYTVGQRLGIDRIHEYATRFGLGQPTGLPLVEEQKGLIPSTAWKRASFSPPNDRWYPGETPSVSIGQGAVTVTPLQVARAMAALVNGGRLLRPYLVKRITSQDGGSIYEGEPFEQSRRLNLEPWVVKKVKDGLVAVVNKKGGTGSRASLEKEFGIAVAGKTGTAQIRRLVGTTTLQDKYSLAWFAGFAPADKPQVVVVALVEGGGHGGVSAAPVAKEVMKAYFEQRLPEEPQTQVASVKTGQAVR